MKTSKSWLRLKAYIEGDLKRSQDEEKKAMDRGNETNRREWFMAAETATQILAVMVRIERGLI